MRGLEPALLALPRTPGLATASCSLPLATGSFSSDSALPPPWGLPFPHLPAVVLGPVWVIVHYGTRALAGWGHSRFPPLLALLLILILM